MGSAKQRTGEGKASVKQRLTRINRALSKFEGELERTVRTLIAKGGHSRQELKSLFDDVIERLRNGQIYALASGTRGSFEAEMKRLKKETLNRFKEIEFLGSGQVFSDIRTGVGSWLGRLPVSPVVDAVREQADKTRVQLFEILNLPDRKNFDAVAGRVDRLEKKLQSISKKAA